MVKTSKLSQARLHALYYFSATTYIMLEDTRNVLDALLKDPHPAIRKHAIALLEQGYSLQTDEDILDSLAKDKNDQVRQQLAYSLGKGTRGKGTRIDLNRQRLARLLCGDVEDRYILAAGLSSISEKNWQEFYSEMMKQPTIPSPLLAPLMRLANAHGQPRDVSRLFIPQLHSQQELPKQQQIIYATEMLDALDKSEMNLRKLLETADGSTSEKILQQLKQIHAEAVKILADPEATINDKVAAMRLLARGLGNDRDDHKIILAFLTPHSADDLQSAAIQQLVHDARPRVAHLLLAPWKSYSPRLRGQVLDLLLSRTLWTRMPLAVLERKEIPANEIDATSRQRFLLHNDDTIREAARKIFAAAGNRERGQIVDEYWLQMPEKADRERGAKLFVKSCASCHQFGGSGQPVGPDLASVGDKSPQGLLTAILDPNRAVEARYVNYVATTKKGQTFTGVLANETSTNITLVGPEGKQQQLLRNELEELSSTGKSLMPEGLEKDLSPQDVADIIEHIRASQQVPKLKEATAINPKP